MTVEHCSTKKSSALNLIGRKFGKLTVMSRASNSNANKTRWNCLCDCGSTTISVGGSLVNGQTSTCGCGQRLAASNIAKKRLDDLTGKEFGRLVVISRSINNASDGKPMWLCKCQCGTMKDIKAANLRNKNTTSCGCYAKENRISRATTHGLSKTIEYIRDKANLTHHRHKTNPVYLSKIRIRSLIRKSLEFRSVRKACATHEILGCDYDQLKTHIEKQFTKGMSWDTFKDIHIDHIVPLSTAKTVEEIYKLNHYTNLRPMWAKDNLRKGASLHYLI